MLSDMMLVSATCRIVISYPIRNSTMTNGVVLDPFLGSSSTLVACCETDRICRGIELNHKIVDPVRFGWSNSERCGGHEGSRRTSPAGTGTVKNGSGQRRKGLSRTCFLLQKKPRSLSSSPIIFTCDDVVHCVEANAAFAARFLYVLPSAVVPSDALALACVLYDEVQPA